MVGVQWPEGNERAVWDVADQWYEVATVLAGPHTDAATAAAEVHNGYGGVGAVDAAFVAAWRGIAEGADAPLPVLLAVTADLGRLVEECGCDIEGAKLEVWIELGILVVELLSVAVAAVLTAGAATPAAGAAMTATRLLIQQIFKRLMGQLASKSLRHGLKEAGERAAKEVTRGGVRGLAKRATRGGLEEAAEESGVTLATQAYQNSTGRAHGLDMTDLGASAVGGLAGGAVAPLAGLGRHATGRAARVGEHLGREMTGEVLADSAASLATGQASPRWRTWHALPRPGPPARRPARPTTRYGHDSTRRPTPSPGRHSPARRCRPWRRWCRGIRLFRGRRPPRTGLLFGVRPRLWMGRLLRARPRLQVGRLSWVGRLPGVCLLWRVLCLRGRSRRRWFRCRRRQSPPLRLTS